MVAGAAIFFVTSALSGSNQAASDRGAAPARSIASAWSWFDPATADAEASWPHSPNGAAWFAGGAYHLFAREPGRFVAIGAPITTPQRDVTVQARFRKVGGPAGGGYGIIVHDVGTGRRDGMSQQGRFYVLEAGDRGEFGIWRREGDRWIDLIPWSPTSAVRRGNESNELTVVAHGDRLRFAINGIEVGTVVDSTLPEGSVGLFTGGDLNEVIVERFAVHP
jgi:hypothetical protein